MLIRCAAIALLLTATASPASSQSPDSTPAPRARAFPRSDFRSPEMRMRIPRIPRIDVQELRRRALERSLLARRELLDRGFAVRLRADARRNMLDDRSWQRRREVETRAMARVRDLMSRVKLRQPLLRRRHFRDI